MSRTIGPVEQTKRAQMLTDDDLKRDKAALDAWTKTWVAGAQFGTPVPIAHRVPAGDGQQGAGHPAARQSAATHQPADAGHRRPTARPAAAPRATTAAAGAATGTRGQ